jgi:outer membrane protein TolC
MNLKNQAGSRLKIPLCLAILILLCANIAAQQTAEPMRLSPDEAVALAVRNNLALESSRTNLETRRRASNLSWNQFIPNVTAAGTLIRNNQQGSVSGFVPVDMADALNPLIAPLQIPSETLFGVFPFSVDLPQWNVAGTIQASLNLNFAMFENMRRLRLDYQSGLLSYEKARAQLERDVRKAYHNMLLLQENIALLQGSFANAERQVQIAQANFNAGLAPELTLLQARVARENMRPIIDQTENGLKLSMATFAMYLGLDYDTPFELIPVMENIDFIPFDIAQMISRAAAGKPDIQELRHTIMLLESARRMQVASLTPSLTLSWNSTSAFTGDPWKDSWFSSENDWRRTGSLNISLGVRLHSLIPFSVDYQGIRNLEDQIRIANIGLAQMINGTEIEIYNILLSLERIHTTAEVQAQTVSLAEQAFRLTELAYQAGLQDYFQVQNAEQSLRQARVQMLEQQFNYINSLIDLEYSIGVPFGTLSSP